MNIILLKPEEVEKPLIILEGKRAQHIARVLRSKPGDFVKIGIINGKIGSGCIKGVRNRQPYHVSLEGYFPDDPPNCPEIDIVLALPRPIMFRRILSQLAALGVGHIYVINAKRVEKSFWDASLLSDQLWHEHLLSGLEQAVDTLVPKLSFHKGFKPFVEGVLPIKTGTYKQMILAHPQGEQRLQDIFKKGSGQTLLAIGPEGGWSEYEVSRLVEAGFEPFSLGNRILKVETAAIVLHGMVCLLNEILIKNNSV